MELLLLILFIGFNSFLVLVTTNFPFAKQSLILGFTGAVVGGMLAFVMRSGLSVRTAETVLFLLLIEGILFLLLSRVLTARTGSV